MLKSCDDKLYLQDKLNIVSTIVSELYLYPGESSYTDFKIKILKYINKSLMPKTVNF